MTSTDAAAPDSDGSLWVFGYGSLMWRPGFAYARRSKALLRGWRRSLCVLSHVYRGSPERPGLVLGLDRGGACPGWLSRSTRLCVRRRSAIFGNASK